MAILLSGVEKSFTRGMYVMSSYASVGTSKIQMSTDGLPFKDLDGTSSTNADLEKEVQLPDCKIKAVLTGDAQLTMNETIIRKG